MDCDSWKTLVHSSFWNSVTSYFLDEDGSTAFVSTTEGAFIEFHKGVIKRSCRTNYSNVRSIEEFFSYHPHKRYFLLKELDILIIIITVVEEMKVHIAVSKYEIGDFSEEGKPQIKVWPINDEKLPFILNFSPVSVNMNSKTTNHSEDFLSCRLHLKLKETKGILDKYIKEVEDKRRLRRETLKRLTLNYPPEPCPPSVGLQHFFGEGLESDFPQADPNLYPLQIHHIWQTTVSEKLLLGWAIRNASNGIILNLKVLLHESPKQRTNYSVKRLSSTSINEVFTRLDLKTPEVFPLPVVTWQEERVDCELPPGKGCILIAVLPFPEFIWFSKKTISGKLLYSFGVLNEVAETSQEFPQFEITARNVLDGSLLPQSVHKQFLHAVSTIAVCEKVVLTVTTGIVPSRSVEDLLTSGIGFLPASRGNGFFTHPGCQNNALGGCMIQVVQSSEGFKLHLYAKSREILRLLVYCVVESCPGSWNISHGSPKSPDDARPLSSSVTLGDCSDALAKEIHCIVYNLSKWKKDETLHTISTDVNSYINFRKEVTTLQKKSDVIFSSLELEASKGGHVIYH